MDKTFNFFKSKLKKEAEKTRNYSKSNSSKASAAKSTKGKEEPNKIAPLSQKQKQIRTAIQNRYQKSKLRNYRFERQISSDKRNTSSSHSSECEQYAHLKKLKVADINEYHNKQSIRHSDKSLREKSGITLKLKIGSSLRTEADSSCSKQLGHSVKALNKITAADSSSKKKDEWKLLNLEGKQNISKQKNVKGEAKINSERSSGVKQEGPKLKANSSLQKGLDRAKPKAGSKLPRTRF